MSTIDRPQPRILPPLVAGESLDQPTFHARYEAKPPGVRAELIEGIVYMPSPSHRDHGSTSRVVSYWLGHYQRFTPRVVGEDNATTILGVMAEPQPDAVLRIATEAGGATRTVDGYIVGPPEFVVEVARSSRRTDLGSKLRDYERAGVLEYLIISLDPHEIHWNARREGRFARIAAGADGLSRSEVFPGLWLDASALFDCDLGGLIAALDRGLATPEHAAFVARLAGHRGG